MRRQRTRRWVLAVVCVAVGAELAACSPRPSIGVVPPEPPPAVRRGDDAFRYQDYDRAIDAYGSYLEKVRTGPYTAVAEYKSALAAYRLKRYDQTLFILDDLDTRYPDGKWMQVDALRGDAERALGRNMLAIRAWADAWELAGPEDQQKLARRFQSVARTMDGAQLAEARSLVENDEIRDLLYPEGTGIPVIGEPLHEPEDDEGSVAAPRRAVAVPSPKPSGAEPPVAEDAGEWAPPDLADLPTVPPVAPEAVPPPKPSAARREPAAPAAPPPVDVAPPAPRMAEPDALPTPAPVPVAAARLPEPPMTLPANPPDTTIRGADARIGVLLPVTGRHGAAGAAAWQAIQLAFVDAPARLLLVDTGGGVEAAALDKLWSDPDVVAVIGPFEHQGTANAGTPVDGLPAIELPETPGAGPVRLSLGTREVDLLGPLLRYATVAVQLRRIAVLYPETAAGRSARDAVERAVDNMGGTILGTIGYPAGTDAVAAAGERLLDWREKQNLQAVFLADDAAQARGLATFLRREMPDVTLLGAAQWDALADGGAATDGILFAESFFPGSTRPPARDFVVAYEAAYSGQPGGLAAEAYDVATVARRALALGVDSRPSMRERVREVGAINGASGLVEVTDEGFSRPGVVLQVYDGKLAEVGRSG